MFYHTMEKQFADGRKTEDNFLFSNTSLKEKPGWIDDKILQFVLRCCFIMFCMGHLYFV